MSNDRDVERLRSLPFDQYSRQELVKQLIDACFRPTVRGFKKSLKVIDVGGHKGHTRDFLTKDAVTVLDVYDEVYSGYIKGDGTNTSFKDEAFDLSVSFDTLEHIPSELRNAFIKEGVRISKYGFIITAPFDTGTGSVRHAEEAANRVYNRVKNEDHPWLKEHLEYGTPTLQEIESCVSDEGWYLAKIPTNNLYLWLLTQGLMFNAAIFESDTKEVVDVSRYYNSHLASLEAVPGAAYRYIVVVSKQEQMVESIESYLEGLQSHAKQNVDKTLVDYLEEITTAYTAMLLRLRKDVEYLQTREKHLQIEYDKLAEIYESVRKDDEGAVRN